MPEDSFMWSPWQQDARYFAQTNQDSKIETALHKFSKEFGSTTLQIPGVNEGLGSDSLS